MKGSCSGRFWVAENRYKLVKSMKYIERPKNEEI